MRGISFYERSRRNYLFFKTLKWRQSEAFQIHKRFISVIDVNLPRQGPLTTDRRNSSKVTGPTVRLKP